MVQNSSKIRIPTIILLACGTIAATIGASSQPPSKGDERFSQALFQGMKWRNIGPHRGGRSVAVAGIRSEPDTYYFGAVGGGVWKTGDAGETWKNVSDDQLGTSSVGAIAVAPSDPNVVYVGMGEHAIRGVMTSHGDGVYRSVDAGRTWTHLGLPSSRAISRIRIHPNNPDLVYVAVQGAPYGPSEERGVYRSSDGGQNWERLLYVGDTAGAADLAMDPRNPRILYAAFWDHLRQPWEVRSGGAGSGFYKSTDGGNNWEAINNGLPDLLGKLSIDVSADSDRLYAIVEADPGGGLYRSDDAGKKWTLVNESWTIRARAWYYIEVFADPLNRDVVYVLDAPMTKSVDGGKTFTTIRTPHGDHHDLWINPEHSNIMINANDGGANISFDGGQIWSTQQNQPTAQFYRVNTDNRFPYFVYGGQQDNSSVAIASRSRGGGIGWQDWYGVGGCESAYTGFDKDNPRYVYAGCYMGIITEWDASTRTTRNVMAYPVMPAAVPPLEMKYRFNWNAPILVSKHDSRVVYHAANVVLKTVDRGVSWQEVSPDLTRDDKEKQGPGGAPITNEGAGGEIYNTIYYLAESPHDGGTLWAGSDDGLVHVTRDGGNHWENVTPPGIGESMINAIEVSPHDPAKAYLAVNRYKFNDFTPLAFKTQDYGKTWNRISDEIPPDHWVHVVREDPGKSGLLYLGTESGMFVSFDDGQQWQLLQLNLPLTPINDLQVAHGDLVAATSGRSFWILDDLSPLRQLSDEVASAESYLFAPTSVERFYSGGSGNSDPRAGQNRANAYLDFHVAKMPEDGIVLEIIDDDGNVIRRIRGEKEAGEAERPISSRDPRPLEIKEGMNRIAWDLRHDPIRPVPGLYVFGSLQGAKVIPGTYQVRLTAGESTLSRPFELRPDPRVQVSPRDYLAQRDFLRRISADLEAIHDAVLRLRDARQQIKAVMTRAEAIQTSDGPAMEAGRELVDRLDALEDVLVQKRTVDGQTVINFPMQLNQFYIYLRSAVDSGEAGVTQGARDRFADLSQQWVDLQGQLDRLLGQGLSQFNDLAKSIPAVFLKEPR